jgi:hypothetical protein
MSNSTFVKGLAACVAAMLAFGVGIGFLNHGTSRPEGVAERWLTAVGDTPRKGVEADARKRAEKIGAMSLVDRRLVQPNPDRKTAFPDLEVGKAVSGAPDHVRVRFRAHTRRGTDAVEVGGVIGLAKVDGVWHVTTVEIAGDANTDGLPAAQLFAGVPELASDGGPPPSSAPASLWLAGLVGAAIIGVITTSLVRLAGRGTVVPVTS